MRLPVVLAALALAAAGCGSSADDEGSSGSGSGTTEVELDDNYFKPKTITGDAGSTVKLELTNEGQAEHTFTIDGGVDKELEPGDSAELSVELPSSGTIEFYCRYHKASGMVGQLGGSGSVRESGNSRSGY